MIEKLKSLKEDESVWSTLIDAILKDIDDDKIGVEGETAELKLRSLKKLADEVPPNSRGTSSSKRVKEIHDTLVDYRNAFANYNYHP